MEWPAYLVQELARRRCVPLIGAGVSRNSTGDGDKRPPLWKEFVQVAVDKLERADQAEPKKLLRRNDLLTATHIAREKMGRADWCDLLEQEFSTPNYRSAAIHEHIFQLDSPLVCSTNIDKIYETYVVANYQGACVQKNYNDTDLARYVRGDPFRRTIIKVHGSVDALDHAIFTKSDYADAWSKAPQFYELFSALILTNTFLFIGYSLSDPDIQLILEQSARLFVSSKPHYLVTSDRPTPITKQFYEQNYNVKILTYDGKGNHEALSTSLKDLGALTIQKRQELADRQTW
jgi:hypothetical protein